MFDRVSVTSQEKSNQSSLSLSLSPSDSSGFFHSVSPSTYLGDDELVPMLSNESTSDFCFPNSINRSETATNDLIETNVTVEA